MSWLSLTQATTILDHDLQRGRKSLERAISKAWMVGAGGSPAPAIDANVPLRVQVTPSPGWRLVGRDWLDHPVLHWETSEIECLCAMWRPPGASQPATSSQSRARIEIWRDDIARLWGGPENSGGDLQPPGADSASGHSMEEEQQAGAMSTGDSDLGLDVAGDEILVTTTVQVPKSLKEIVKPEACALVVYDMQVGILSQLPHSAEVLAKVLDVLNIARQHGFRIFFLRHMSLPTKLAGVFQLRQAMAWQGVDKQEAISPWFLRGTPGFELAPELDVRADEAIFDKISMSAFEGTPLAMALRDCGVISFMICGIATEIGIDPTVRHGADLGLIPIVIEDACGPGDRSAAERSIENIRFMGDAFVTNVEELRNTLDSMPAN